MTFKSVSLAACLALLANGAIAKTVTLSAGDHKDFTRIVVPLPAPNTKWTLSETDQGYSLFLRGEDIEFDHSGIFKKISRNRLSQVTNTNGRLDLGLGCNCEISNFLWQNRFLILDIRQSNKAKPRLAKQSPFHIAPSNQHIFQSAGLLSSGENIKQPEIRLPLAPKPKPAEGQLDLARSLQSANLDSEKDALLKGVLKATSHGLLTPQKRPAEGRKSDAKQDKSPTQLSIKATPDPLKNLSVQSVFDKEFDSTRDRLKAQPDRRCIPDHTLSIADWSNGEPFDLQISNARMALVGDLQEPDPIAVVALAKTYIHFGFGAEALAALSILEPPVLNSTELSVVAQAIDGQEQTRQNPFSGMQSCATAASLWSLLSQPASDGEIDVDTNSVLSAFIDLPTEFRNTIAGPLSQKLIAAKKEDAARQVLHMNNQYGAQPNDETDLAQAQIELKSGQFETAEPILQEVASQSADSSPVALAQLIKTQFENGRAIDPDLAAIADAFSIEYRELEEGPSIRHAHILARTSNQEYFKAFQALTISKELDEPELWTSALQQATQHATENSADDVFLRIALNELNDKRRNLSPDTINAVAQRLHLLGLNEEASKFAALGAEGAIGRDRRLLRAKISLATGKPRQAEAHLLGLSGTDVDDLRAKARLTAGELSKAHEIYASLGNTDAADKLAWRTGNWSALQNTDQPLYQNIANLMLANTIDEIEGETPELAKDRNLLKNSEETRQNLDKILQGFQFDSALRQEN